MAPGNEDGIIDDYEDEIIEEEVINQYSALGSDHEYEDDFD